jgi:DNA polymerase III subunit beta
MKFTLRKADILTLLQKVVNIVPVRSTLPILSNISVQINGSILVMRATDLDLSITTTADIGSAPGNKEFIVNAKRLFDIIKELPETDITFDLSGKDFLKVVTPTDEFKLPVQSAENFPETPAFKELFRFTIKSSTLDEMSARVRFAVARDTTRAALKGVLCELSGSTIKMVATDGHKLSLCREDNLPEKTKEKIAIIVPPKALEQLSKIIVSPDDNITVRVGQIYAEFSANKTSVTTKLIEGDYPNYEEAIPKSNPKKAVVKRDELFSVLRRISVMSNSRTRQVRFAFAKNSLTVSTSDRDFRGEGKSSLSVQYDGEAVTIGFNADFFIEILRLLDDEDVVVSMSTPLAATIIQPVTAAKSGRMLFLIMPLRLLDEETNE